MGIYDTRSSRYRVKVNTGVTGLPVFVLGDVLVVNLLLLRCELLVYVMVRENMIRGSLLFVFCSFGS